MKSRTKKEIAEAVGEFCDKVWYNRHQNLLYRIKSGEEILVKEYGKNYVPNVTSEDTLAKAKACAKEIREKYKDHQMEWDDFEWGMINGKLSALRWVLGDDWDMLDT